MPIYCHTWYVINDREILPSNYVDPPIYQPCDATWAEPEVDTSRDKPYKNQVLLSFKGTLYSKPKLG